MAYSLHDLISLTIKHLLARWAENAVSCLSFISYIKMHIHRQLLVADCVLQHGFVQRLEARQLLLLLLHAADQCQLSADLQICVVADHLVAKLHGFKLRAVHQDDAALGIGIHSPG